MTRFHVLTPSSCTNIISDFIVKLTQGKGQKRLSSSIGQVGNTTILSLSSPMSSSSSDVSLVKLSRSTQVIVVQKHERIQCQADKTRQLLCSGGLIHVDSGWPVLNQDDKLVGFSNNFHAVDDNIDMDRISEIIAEDFRNKHENGEKKLLKCRRTENMALEFVLVYLNSLGSNDKFSFSGQHQEERDK